MKCLCDPKRRFVIKVLVLKSETWKQQELFYRLLCTMTVVCILLTHVSLFKYEELTSSWWAVHYFESKRSLFETSYFGNWTYPNYARENNRLQQSTHLGKTARTPEEPLSVVERLYQNKIRNFLKFRRQQTELRYVQNGLISLNISAHQEKLY